MPKILITICARGGSKGIPGKNTKPINGLPLIGYSIEMARAFQQKYPTTDLVLSTDSMAIQQVAAELGLPTNYTRPAELANDTAGKIAALRHVWQHQEQMQGVHYDYVLDLDVTSPLRTLADLEAGLALIDNNPAALNLFSVSLPHRNPYFNMVEAQPNGYFATVRKLESAVLSRQQAPQVYDINGSFYFYRRLFFEIGSESAITDRTMVYEMPHVCFDLDEPIDFDFLEYLLINKKLPFL